MRYHQRKDLKVLVAGTSPFNDTVIRELLAAKGPVYGNSRVGSITAVVGGDAERRLARHPGLSFVPGDAADPAVLERAGSSGADVILVNAYGSGNAERETKAVLRALREPRAAPKPGAQVSATGRGDGATRDGTAFHCVEDVFTRLIAQSARQRGLARVYRELLSFHGNDFYFLPGRDLAGITFSRCLRAFANACPVGIRRGGKTTLNPAMTDTIGHDDELVILAHSLSDVTKNPSILPIPDETSISRDELATMRQESYLFLGWNRLCPGILAEINRYSHEDSVAGITAEGGEARGALPRLGNLALTALEGSCYDDAFLGSIPWEHWENVIIPGTAEPGDGSATERLSAVRSALATRGFENNLTAVSWKADDGESLEGVLSVTLVFRILAQLALNPGLSEVITEITSPVGAEIYLKPVENYVVLDKPCDFYTILESAKRKGETAIGFTKSGNPSPSINPPKAQKERFGHFDRIVVLADEN